MPETFLKKNKFLKPNLVPNQERDETGGVISERVLNKKQVLDIFASLNGRTMNLIIGCLVYNDLVPRDWLLEHAEDYDKSDEEIEIELNKALNNLYKKEGEIKIYFPDKKYSDYNSQSINSFEEFRKSIFCLEKDDLYGIKTEYREIVLEIAKVIEEYLE